MIREMTELLTIQRRATLTLRKGQKSAKEDGKSKATLRQIKTEACFLQTSAEEELEAIHPP